MSKHYQELGTIEYVRCPLCQENFLRVYTTEPKESDHMTFPTYITQCTKCEELWTHPNSTEFKDFIFSLELVCRADEKSEASDNDDR